MVGTPLVSIITPVLNGAKYLAACLDAVLGQTYSSIEHVVVDGGSTDGTLDIIADYQVHHPGRIRLATGHNRGVGEAVNRGFAIAKGQIIGWIDSDDFYEPIAVQTAIDFLTKHPTCCLVYGGCNIVDSQGTKTGVFPVRDFDAREAVNNKYCVVFCAAFYRRGLIDKVGYLNTLGNDLDFWLRVDRESKLCRINTVLANWRWHQDSISGSSDPDKVRMRKSRLMEDYVLGRKYGAGLFCPRNRRYYRFRVLDSLHLYPLIRRITK